MWIKKTKVESLQGKIAAKDIYIAELEAVVNEVRRFITTQAIEHEGKANEPHVTARQLINQLRLILLAAPKIGRSRQRSVAVRYDGSHVGRRRNTD